MEKRSDGTWADSPGDQRCDGGWSVTSYYTSMRDFVTSGSATLAGFYTEQDARSWAATYDARHPGRAHHIIRYAAESL